jgi:hypothetical protein
MARRSRMVCGLSVMAYTLRQRCRVRFMGL